jgi:hypothetical protein
MRVQYSTPNKVSLCKKDVCVNVYGDAAKVINTALTIVAVASAIIVLAKALK